MLFLTRHCENRETENNFSLRSRDVAETYIAHTYTTRKHTHTRDKKSIFSLFQFAFNPMSHNLRCRKMISLCIFAFVFFFLMTCESQWPITCLRLQRIPWVFMCLQQVSHQWITWNNDSYSGACVIHHSLAVSGWHCTDTPEMGLLVLFCFFSSENEYISNWWLIKEGFAIISRGVGSRVCDIHSP